MARPIDEFTLAWNALAGSGAKTGWRSIAVAPAGACHLMAARHFPGNEEALLAGFPDTKLATAERLPEGRGFEVCRADPHGDGRTWIAVTRKEEGNRELFAAMVCDIAGALDAEAGAGEEKQLRSLLARIRSWQEFMRRGMHVLAPEAEIGLIGELVFLDLLIRSGIAPAQAIDSWLGPLDAPQDFALGTGAIEVKASQSTTGFPARIGSLEQLDDALLKPLFLAAIRLARSESGRNLPEFAEALQPCMLEAGVGHILADRLLAAGYHVTHADRYPKRFALQGVRIFSVDGDFPRLVPGRVPDGITRAAYDIDLDRVGAAAVGVEDALHQLGALSA